MPPTAVALAFTLWQLLYSPREQYQQLPQKMLNGTITRSPTWRFCTDDPTSSTTPMNSCPNVWPIRVSGIIPWYRCRSEPQIAASWTRTIASLGCSIRGLSFSSTRSLYGPRYVIARMVPPKRLRTRRPGARPQPRGNARQGEARGCVKPPPHTAGRSRLDATAALLVQLLLGPASVGGHDAPSRATRRCLQYQDEPGAA